MKNHSFIGLLGALLFSCFPFFNIAVCRDAPVTTVGSANPCPGNSITIPVYVDNFTNITAITLRIEYDPAVMTFNNFSGNPVLSGIIANAIPVGEGSSLYKVMIVWTDIHPKTLDNGSSIIDLAFSYLSGDGSLVFNNTSGGGGDCEYADETWMPMNDIPTEQFYHHGTILNAGAGPAGEISGSSVICQGSNNISYAVAPIANATGYTWSLPAGAAIASGENTNTIIVNFNPDANSGLISVFGYNTACLAGGTPSPDYWVTVHPLPTSALSGSTIICAGNTASLTIDLTGTAPWNITYTDGTNQFNINDIASSPYLLEVAPSETTSYWVTMVSDGNNCTGAGSGIATINVNPLPTASLSGSATICAGSSASLTVNLTGTAPWDITYTDGTNQFNINDIASSPYPFEVAPSETTSYWVTMVSDGNNCTGAGSGIATVNVNPLPTASLSGSATICAGNTASLTIDLTGTAPWNITYTDGSNQFNINDIASSPYLLEVAPSETTSYWVTMVSDGNNCTGAGSGIATVNVNPLPTASLSGSATICAGNTASLTVNLTGTAPWDLTYTDGTNQFNINDIASSPYPFEVAPSETTSYWVTMVSDGNNCTNTGSESITIEVNPLPTATLSGSTAICAGSSASLTVNLTGTAPWDLTYTDGTNQFNINDIASSPYPFEVAPSETTSYWVTMVSDGNNCTNTGSESITIEVNPLPTATLSGSTAICAGSSASLTINLTGTAPWDITYTDGTTTIDINDINSTPFVFDIAPLQTQTYLISNVSDGNSCANEGTGSAEITVNPIPDTPVATSDGLVLSSSSEYGNQWYYEGTGMIPGATGQTYTVTNNTGYYWCTVTLEGCTSPASNSVWVLVTGSQEVKNQAAFKIYPIPNNGLFRVELRNTEEKQYSLIVYSPVGNKVFEQKDIKPVHGLFEKEIDLRMLPDGLYSVVCTSNSSSFIRKVLKVR